MLPKQAVVNSLFLEGKVCLHACVHNSTSRASVCHLCIVRLVDSFQYVSAGGGSVFNSKCCLCLSLNVGVCVYAFIQKRGGEEGGGCV